ncbi:MAG: hypothetical protein LUH11_03730 [Candidatus Gastranaerophilales bacterium]|nr:hypothetical protein [Candidatus Gastranaerophilales bacterium]
MATVKLSQQTYNNFSGGYACEQAYKSQDKVSFIGDSKNIDVYSADDDNSGYGFKKILGNTLYTQIKDEQIKGLFVYQASASEDYLIIYTVNDTEGKLYYMDINNSINLIIDGLDKDATQCSFVNFSQTLPNKRYLGIFGNGSDPFIKFEMNADPKVEEIDETDIEGRSVRSAVLEVFYGRVWCAVADRVHWSKSLDPFTWATDEDDAGYNQLDGDVIGLSTYADGLIISTNRSIYYCAKDTSDSGFVFSVLSPNHAVSSRGIVKHANYTLYMASDGIYPVNTTQENTKLVQNDVSWLISNYYRAKNSYSTDDMFACSVVCSDKNEVWFHIPMLNGGNKSYIFIYRFLQGHQKKLYWLPPRIQQKINCLCVFKNLILSGTDNGEILRELSGTTFNGENIEAIAEFPELDFNGTYNKQKFKLYLYSELNKDNKFYVDYFYDGESEYDRQEVILENSSFNWDEGNWDEENWAPIVILQYQLDKPRKHNRLKVRFIAENSEQDFTINRIETTKIKVKNK